MSGRNLLFYLLMFAMGYGNGVVDNFLGPRVKKKKPRFVHRDDVISLVTHRCFLIRFRHSEATREFWVLQIS